MEHCRVGLLAEEETHSHTTAAAGCEECLAAVWQRSLAEFPEGWHLLACFQNSLEHSFLMVRNPIRRSDRQMFAWCLKHFFHLLMACSGRGL